MTRIATPCPTCGRIRHLRPNDAKRTRQCRRCHLKAIAPLGFQAAADKYGRQFFTQKARDWRLAHPSSLEQQVEDVLSEIPGIAWEREYAVDCGDGQKWFVDFLVYAHGQRVALEAQGQWVHTRPAAPQKVKIRAAFLRGCFDELIFLEETQIQSPDFADDLRQLLRCDSPHSSPNEKRNDHEPICFRSLPCPV